MSFSSKPKALATLGVYRKLVHILEVYHKKEVVNKQIKKGIKKGRIDLPLNVPLYDQKPCLEWFQYVHHLMNSRLSFLLF